MLAHSDAAITTTSLMELSHFQLRLTHFLPQNPSLPRVAGVGWGGGGKIRPFLRGLPSPDGVKSKTAASVARVERCQPFTAAVDSDSLPDARDPERI